MTWLVGWILLLAILLFSVFFSFFGGASAKFINCQGERQSANQLDCICIILLRDVGSLPWLELIWPC